MRPRLILASRSPQRRAILEQLGVPFELRPQDVDECDAGDPEQVARENALAKARAAASAAEEDRLVLAVDTIVALGGRLYGKAASERAARASLEALSGNVHQVWSAIAIIEGDGERLGSACTDVAFRTLDSTLVDWYLASGEWRERAGAYAIQGRGSALVERIEGDYWNVVGLPVALLMEMEPGLIC